MAKNDHTGAFIFGTILGGAVGAVAALWNTPQSGKELRQTVGLESEPVLAVTDAVKTTAIKAKDVAGEVSTSVAAAASSGRPMTDVVLDLVGQATAPLVGVKIGQTANNSQPGAASSSTEL
jgi:gas vesicle protein